MCVCSVQCVCVCVNIRREQTKVAVASIVKWNNQRETIITIATKKKHEEGTEMGQSVIWRTSEIQIDLCTTHYSKENLRKWLLASLLRTYLCGCVCICVCRCVCHCTCVCVCVRVNARGMLSMYHVSHSICTYVCMSVCIVLCSA